MRKDKQIIEHTCGNNNNSSSIKSKIWTLPCFHTAVPCFHTAVPRFWLITECPAVAAVYRYPKMRVQIPLESTNFLLLDCIVKMIWNWFIHIYYMSSICFDESCNLIGCWRGSMFPYCPRAVRNFYCPATRAELQTEKMSKSLSKLFKTKKNKPKIKKRSNCCG
jgi:hypothetical protein